MIDLTQEEITRNWGVDDSDNPLVSIKCMTFNHEKYIAQCIEGFLIQKTNFPFEILIHDDCSTDKTESIVREYEKRFPKIIKGLYETENQWQKGCGAHHTKIDAAIKGKYIAVCEGDDYWIDENKLQMQVDFLENNPEYGMCYTKAQTYIQNEKRFAKKTTGKFVDGFNDLLLNGSRIPTLTTVYRKDLLDKYQEDINPADKGWMMGDVPMWLYFTYFSKIKFIDEVTAVYRVLEESASHSFDINKQLKFVNSAYDIRYFYINKFNLDYDLTTYHSRAILRTYATNLFQKYNSKVAKEFRDYYKTAIYKSKKFDLYSFLSHSVITWKFVKFLKIIFDN